LSLLAGLASPADPGDDDRDMMAPAWRTVRWCADCGAPLNLGCRDCPGCRLLDEQRTRLATYLARHGMPEGGPIALARLAEVPLRAVGELMVTPERRRARARQRGWGA
jgi:hypothetical protein